MEDILEQARRVLSTTPARWESMAQALPAELLGRPPAAGEWSALECLQHLLDSEVVFNARIKHFLAGQDFPTFNPAGAGKRFSTAPAEMAAGLARLRQQSLAALAALTPDDLERRVRHSELGPVTLGELVHQWAAHDLDHTVQAERALMPPFILGCGPWQVYYPQPLVK